MSTEAKQIPVNPPVTDVIDVPIESAWQLIKDFGNWGTWWPYYEYMELIGDRQDKVGAVRRFKTLEKDGPVYEETLTVRDHANYRLAYDFKSMTPANPAITKITTTIQLEVDNPKQTKITWGSVMQVANGFPDDVLKKVYAKQSLAYASGIKSIIVTVTVAAVWQQGLNFFQDKAMSLTKALMVGQGGHWDYQDYPAEFGELPKAVRGLPKSEVLTPRKVGQMMQRFLEVAYLKGEQTISDMLAENARILAGEPENHIDVRLMAAGAVLKMVNYYGTPQNKEVTKYLTEHWYKDNEFCQQFLSGVNPFQIQVVKNESQIPANMRTLTGQGKTVKELIQEKRLFIVDYKELANLKPKAPMVFYAPIAVFYKELLEDKTQLQVLGIKLDRSENGIIYTPKSEHKNRYALAKLFVAEADNQVAEFYYHLAQGHLSMEPIVVATHNALPDNHPIKVLLKPHLTGTIGINYAARQVLVPEKDPFTDHTFAIGTRQGLIMSSDMWREYDFFGSSFLKNLEKRGFDQKATDGLENYYYRDDGFQLWDAIGTYTEDTVNHFYKTNADILADQKLQEWANEMSAPEKANMKGFPSEIDTKRLLQDILQVVIWNGSALHSVVNFAQWPCIGFTPNRPNGLYAAMPAEDGKDISDEYIQMALVPKHDSLFLTEFARMFQIAFTWLLTLPSETSLRDVKAMEQLCPHAHERFQENLIKLSGNIKVRNVKEEKEGRAGYVFLLPENVAASVDI